MFVVAAAALVAALFASAGLMSDPLRLGRLAGAWRMAPAIAFVACTSAWLRRDQPLEAAAWLWLSGIVVATLRTDSVPLAALLPYALSVVAFAAARRARMPLDDARLLVLLVGVGVAATVLLESAGLLRASAMPPGGILRSRNFAGELLALVLPIALVTTRKRSAPALLALGGALLLTRCRTAWIAAALAVAVLVVLDPRARTRLWIVIVGALIAALLPQRLQWREPSPYLRTAARLVDLRHGSGALRMQQYAETVRLLRGRELFGVGPGQWQHEMRTRDGTLAHNGVPHSDVIRIAADGGVVALSGFGFLLAAVAIGAWSRRRHAPDELAFIVALLATSLADAVLFRPETLLLCSFWLGTTLAAARSAEIRDTIRAC